MSDEMKLTIDLDQIIAEWINKDFDITKPWADSHMALHKRMFGYISVWLGSKESALVEARGRVAALVSVIKENLHTLESPLGYDSPNAERRERARVAGYRMLCAADDASSWYTGATK